MMYETIKNFPSQFAYQPVLEGGAFPPERSRFLLVGMGGSALVGELMNSLYPEISLMIHRNYGLPRIVEETKDEWAVVVISYSGNTEEAIDAYQRALTLGLPTIAIATGGKLLELARQKNSPIIQLPSEGIQPRSAVGFMSMAVLKALGKTEAGQEIARLSTLLDSQKLEKAGKALAKKIKNKIPIIYSSENNKGLAYTWKIKCNETAKIPAFCSVVPEANHNELNSFYINEKTKKLTKHFGFIFLDDVDDHPRVQRRMDVYRNLLVENGYKAFSVPLEGDSRNQKVFSSFVLADWVSYYVAEIYGSEAEQVPMIQEFKQLIA